MLCPVWCAPTSGRPPAVAADCYSCVGLARRCRSVKGGAVVNRGARGMSTVNRVDLVFYAVESCGIDVWTVAGDVAVTVVLVRMSLVFDVEWEGVVAVRQSARGCLYWTLHSKLFVAVSRGTDAWTVVVQI